MSGGHHCVSFVPILGLLNDECLPECEGSITSCFLDPCDPRAAPAPCDAQQNLTCVADYCDGCTARYYDDDCAEVACAEFNAGALRQPRIHAT